MILGLDGGTPKPADARKMGRAMWQRFTERARKVVYYAQEEAQRFGEGYVSTEHLLLGLIRDPDNSGARIISLMGVSLNRVRVEVEKQLPRGDARPNQEMTLTPRAKSIIDLAYDEARTLNNNYIGTEHLLLGLIREGDGLAGRILAKLGVELERARRDVARIQGEEAGGAPSQTESDLTAGDVKWSIDGRAAYGRAVEAVAGFGEGALGAEHLLVGVVGDCECLGAKALIELGVELDDLLDNLRSRVPTEGPPPGVDRAANPRAQAVIAAASEEAGAMGADGINSGHLVLALLIDGDGIAGQALIDQGIGVDALREVVVKLQPPAPPPPETVWTRLMLHSRYAILLAQDVARRRGEAMISPITLLIALTELPEANAVQLFQKLCLDHAVVARRAKSLPRLSKAAENCLYLISPETLRALVGAAQEADLAHSEPIGTGHLLIALSAAGAHVPSFLSGLGFNALEARLKVSGLPAEDKPLAE